MFASGRGYCRNGDGLRRRMNGFAIAARHGYTLSAGCRSKFAATQAYRATEGLRHSKLPVWAATLGFDSTGSVDGSDRAGDCDAYAWVLPRCSKALPVSEVFVAANSAEAGWTACQAGEL